MARSKQSTGICSFCGGEFSKGGMGKHLSSCPERHKMVVNVESQEPPGKKQQLFYLLVRSAESLGFWLHLEMNGTATLKQLDSYLRSIWLECCGHLSHFSEGGWEGDEIPISRKIEKVFQTGIELTHLYDYGTTSTTLIKAVNSRTGVPLTRHPIYLMARNNAPVEPCVTCGEPAVWLCMDCLCEEDEWITLCEKHANEHPHFEDGNVVPLVNSPRVGMCAYDGPAEPPY